MSYSSFTRGEFTRLHTSTPKAVWSHWLSLWFTLLLSSSIQSVTPLSSAMALTLLRNSTQFEMPSSSDMPRRLPACEFTMGAPNSAALARLSRTIGSSLAWLARVFMPSVNANPDGHNVGTSPYFFSVGQSLIGTISNPFSPRRTASRHISSRVIPVFLGSKHPSIADCFSRPFLALVWPEARPAAANPAAVVEKNARLSIEKTCYHIAVRARLRRTVASARHESDGSRSFIFCGLNLKVCNTLRRGGPMPDPLQIGRAH